VPNERVDYRTGTAFGGANDQRPPTLARTQAIRILAEQSVDDVNSAECYRRRWTQRGAMLGERANEIGVSIQRGLIQGGESCPVECFEIGSELEERFE
jgi:hypothetical protein